MIHWVFSRIRSLIFVILSVMSKKSRSIQVLFEFDETKKAEKILDDRC